MLLIDKVRIFDHLLEQHINEAAYLWSQRAYAVNQVHQSRAFILKQERRINLHLKGLWLSPAHSWEPALEAAQNGDSGELFVLACLAFQRSGSRRGDPGKIEQALALAQENPAALPGLASALGWLSDDLVHPFLRPWLDSSDELLRYLSIYVCSLRRLDPRDYLTSILRCATNPDDRTFLRSLRLAGELKRVDLLPEIRRFASPENYWAQWSRLLLGDRSTLNEFEVLSLQPGPRQTQAILLAARCQPVQTPVPSPWLTRLAQSDEQKAQLVIALAALGDPSYIDWLIGTMNDSQLALLGGYAFSAITGIDLNDAKLGLRLPPDGDEPELPAGYENLPQPDPTRVADYWSRHKSNFAPGRYLLGRPKTRDWLETVLASGRQGHREAAALELALLDPQQILASVKQPEPV